MNTDSIFFERFPYLYLCAQISDCFLNLNCNSKFISGSSSVGRAQPCQGWGRGFESRFPLSELRGFVILGFRGLGNGTTK